MAAALAAVLASGLLAGRRTAGGAVVRPRSGGRGDIVITPILHASVQVEHAGTVVHVDPWSAADLSRAKPADLILVTDDPSHHLDPVAIERLRKPGAPVVVTAKATSSSRTVPSWPTASAACLPACRWKPWRRTT